MLFIVVFVTVNSINNSVFLLASYNCPESIDKLKNVRKRTNDYFIQNLARLVRVLLWFARQCLQDVMAQKPQVGNLNSLVIIWSLSASCIILILWKLEDSSSRQHQSQHLDKYFFKFTKVKQDKVHTTGNLSFNNLIQQLCSTLVETLGFTFSLHTSHKNDVRSASM